MPRVNLGELNVHYQQAGAGPDLILIHGLFCNLAFWYLTVVPQLAEIFRVTVYDLRGHGLSARKPAGYRAVDLADDLRLLLEHLGIQSAHFVGHSFGGAVALAFAIRQPECIRSLTLADAWVPSLQPWPGGASRWASLRQRLRRRGIELESSLEVPKVLHGFIEELVSLNEASAPGEEASLDAIQSLLSNANSMALRRWNQLVGRTRAGQEFGDPAGIAAREIEGFRRPALAVFGARSRYLPTLHGLRERLEDCQVQIVPDAGHYFPIVNRVAFTRAVSDFAFQQEGKVAKLAG